MKRQLMAFAAAGILAVSMAGGVSAQADNGSNSVANPNGNCLGVERAERNAKGGDRQQGGFGPAQADAAQTYSPYGRGLQGSYASGC